MVHDYATEAEIITEIKGLIATLRKRRQDLGWSQMKLSEELGIAADVVNKFEREHRQSEPKLSTILRYAHALGCRVNLTVEPLD